MAGLPYGSTLPRMRNEKMASTDRSDRVRARARGYVLTFDSRLELSRCVFSFFFLLFFRLMVICYKITVLL